MYVLAHKQKGDETIFVTYDEHVAESPHEYSDATFAITSLYQRPIAEIAKDLGFRDCRPFEALHEYHAALVEHMEKKTVFQPVYKYEHGGVVYATTPFSCPWDSGQVGYIYLKKDQIREFYNWKNLTQKRIKAIENRLKAEIETFSQWANGEVLARHVVSTEEFENHFDSARDEINLNILDDLDSVWEIYGEAEKVLEEEY